MSLGSHLLEDVVQSSSGVHALSHHGKELNDHDRLVQGDVSDFTKVLLEKLD